MTLHRRAGSTEGLLASDACVSSISNLQQRQVCQACMNNDAASSLEVCLYMAMHEDYPVTLTYS